MTRLEQSRDNAAAKGLDTPYIALFPFHRSRAAHSETLPYAHQLVPIKLASALQPHCLARRLGSWQSHPSARPPGKPSPAGRTCPRGLAATPR